MTDEHQPKQPSEEELSKLKRDLEGYRELILPLNKVLEWEQNYYPAILVGVLTFIFALVWCWEPSVLTTICLVGILVSVVDFAVPAVSSYLFSSAEWTVVQERQFETICVRLLNAKSHIVDSKNWLMTLKADRPKIYLLVMMGVFAVLAWFGSIIDNLFLTYLIVVGVTLVPGLRKHGILQQVADAIGNLRSGSKEKTN